MNSAAAPRPWLTGTLIIVAVLAVAIIAERIVSEKTREHQTREVYMAVGTLRAGIEGAIGELLHAVGGLATHISMNPDIDQATFTHYAKNSLPENSPIDLIAAAPNLIVEFIYPLEGNETAIGINYRTHPTVKHMAKLAIEQRDIIVAGPLDLVQGGTAFVARAPIFNDRPGHANRDELWGLVALVIRTERLYAAAGLNNPELPIDVALRGANSSGRNGEIFYGDAKMFATNSDAITVPIRVGNGEWLLAACPRGGWGTDTHPAILSIRIAAAVLALLLLVNLVGRRRIVHEKQLAEENFRHLFEFSNDAVIISEAKTLRILDANEQAVRYLGYSRNELKTKQIFDLYGGTGREQLDSAVDRLRRDGRIIFETQHQHKYGHFVPVEVSARILHRDGGNLILSSVRDITERLDNEAALEKSRQDLHSAIGSIGEGFTLWDSDGVLQEYNQRYVEMAGSLGHLIKKGVTFRELLEQSFDTGLIVTDLSRDEWVERRLADHRSPKGPYEFRAEDGRTIKISEHLTPDGYCVGIYDDVTELKEANEHIHYRAFYDVLTGLPNRQNFLGILNETLAVSKRSDSTVGLLFIDLDRFKATNDNMGHAMGDRLLQEVAKRIQGCVRESDFVARFSGDEFVVLLRHVDEGINAANVASSIIEQLQSVFHIEEHELFSGASIGIAVSPTDTSDPETLIKYADLAMYQAKSGGRNTYQFFTEEMTRQAQRHAEIEYDLRHSTIETDFELHFQPVVNFREKRVEGAEALVRWRHPRYGLLLPDEFIGVAEETRTINPLGEWILTNAARHAQAWHAVNDQLRLGVNVSSRQFFGGFDAAFLHRVLRATGFPAERLVIEITESLVLEDDQRVTQSLRDIRDMGVGIAIDDFGTGYSALSYLRRFPVSMIKVDRSFIADIAIDAGNALLVESIIAMANALSIKVIAEGIETAAQRDLLLEMGCDCGQGNLLGTVVAADEFIDMYTTPVATDAVSG